jgi:hypothetical protein
MKYYLLTLILLSNLFKIYSQNNYYASPTRKLDITLTIKEPYKPMDWGKFSNDISRQLSEIQKHKEAQKKYLNDILFESINSIHSNTVLTNDNLLNSKLLDVKQKVIDYLNFLNFELNNGRIQPNVYETKLRKAYYDYMGANQLFLNINLYKTNKISELNDSNKREIFINKYEISLKSLESFGISENGITFNLNGLSYNYNNLNNLYNFISSSCEGSLDSYKSQWEAKKNNEKKIKLEKEKYDTAIFQKQKSSEVDWHYFKIQVFDSRKDYLNRLSFDEKLEYFKSEKKQVFDYLMSEYTWSFSTKKMIKNNVEEYINFSSQNSNFNNFINTPFPYKILISINNILPNSYKVYNIPEKQNANFQYVN